MPHISRKSKRNILLFLAVLLLGVIANWTSSYSTVIYCGLIFAWLLSVRRRILIEEIRRYLGLGAALLLLLFLLRIFRYELADLSPLAGRYLWYAYYIPFTAVPLCSLCAALCVGAEGTKDPLRYANWLWLLCGCLVAAILTNDLHGTMFRMEDYGRADIYEYGFLYYLTVLWCAVVTIAALAVLLCRCRLSQCRRLWYIPVIAALWGVGLLAWYFIAGGSPKIGGVKLYNLQEAFAVLFIGFWECCIQIGLIPSNTDYDKIFALAPLNAFMTDAAGRVLLRSMEAAVPAPEIPGTPLETPVNVDEDHILHSHAIRDGVVYWVEDVTSINAANREIASAIEYLEDEQALLFEEARIESENASYEMQNRLYDSISPLVRPQLSAAQRLLSEENMSAATFEDHLTLSMVLCVYVKRRVNLALLAARGTSMSVGELELAIRETLEYLKLRGVVCGLERVGGEEDIAAPKLLLAYDFFASVVETALPKLSAMFVLLRTGEAFGLDIHMGTPAAQLAEHWRLRQRETLHAVMRLSEDDGFSYARLRFGEEAAP